jgi:hypothetical protein
MSVELKTKTMSAAAIEPHIMKTEAHKVAVKYLEENIEDVNRLITEKRNDEDGINQGEIEPETLSHNTEDQDFILAMQQKIVSLKKQLTLINGFKNEAPTTIVDPGSLVFVQDQAFYVSTSVKSFNYSGQKVTCISVEAPIYKAMKGLTSGDTFNSNGKSYTISEII